MLFRFIMLLSLLLSTGISLGVGAFESYTWLWLLPLVALGFVILFVVLVFVYLLILCKLVKPDQEQDGDDRHYRKVAELVIESAVPLVRLDVKTKGLNKVPADGRFVLVC